MGSVLSIFGSTAAENRRASAGGPETASSGRVPGASTPEPGPSSKVAPPTTVRDPGVGQPFQEAEIDESWPPDQCGLEDYGPEVKDWEGPQRIKECKLNEEQKEKVLDLFDQCFSKQTMTGMRIIFQPDDVMEMVDMIIPYLDSEPMLIEDVPFGVTIVGDLHGQLYDLERVFKGDAKGGKPGWECHKYVFLGDYVDRGRQSLEIVMSLFCLKMLYPDRIFLLRGNHEFLSVNLTYGFFTDLQDRYEEKVAWQLFYAVNEAFSYLSIAAIVGNIYFCSHGGVSGTGFTRRHMRGMYKPLIASLDDSTAHDITWSDPAQGLRGSTWNKDRGSSIYFGFDDLCLALASMEVVAIFRGHSRIEAGFEGCWNTVFTVFTATDYNYQENTGALAVIDERGKVGVRLLEADKGRTEWENILRRIEYNVPENEDEKTVDDIGDNGVGHITQM